MRRLIADHAHNYYLKPGEALVSRQPVLVTTVLGSCVSVTMFSPSQGVGAICHAMLPGVGHGPRGLHYVETAVRYLHGKMMKYGALADVVVKVFGGAQVLDAAHYSLTRLTVGEQNVSGVEEILRSLGLTVTKADTGGTRGRKLFFSMKNGDVYLRRMGRRCDLVDQVLQP